MCRSTRLRVSILHHTLGNPSKPPAHLNFLKQPVPCLNSPLHKLYVVVKCSSQRITVCRLWIRKKSLNKGWFSGLHMMLIRQLNYKNKLKYNTRSRSDTSDTSYLQKCSPNVMCYFWSPCKKAICLKSHSHFQFKNSPGYPHMRWSNSRWLLKFPELISEHCLDQRQFPWPDNQLFLIPKIFGPGIFSFWTAAGSMTMQITGFTCSLVQRACLFWRTLQNY